MSDKNTKDNLNEIPSGALTFSACKFELGDNGEGAKSAPIKLQARSGQPIEHWYWGKVVHDLDGMKLSKSRLPVDYCHYDHEVIGYLNKFDTDTGDLIVGGALVPFKDSDRATEIIYKSKEGVPYEASINFGGDGIKVQFLDKDEMADVNGYQLEGPATIIREWPLRGVAICPYGADANTETSVFNDKNKTFTAEVFKPAVVEEEQEIMSDTNSVEDTAQEVKTEATNDELTQVETPVIEEPVEEVKVEAELTDKPVVETEKPEGVEELTVEAMSKETFSKIKTEFGAEIASNLFESDGTYQDALKLAYEASKERIAELEKANATKEELKGGKAVPVVSATKTKKGLFNTGK